MSGLQTFISIDVRSIKITWMFILSYASQKCLPGGE